MPWQGTTPQQLPSVSSGPHTILCLPAKATICILPDGPKNCTCMLQQRALTIWQIEKLVFTTLSQNPSHAVRVSSSLCSFIELREKVIG